MCSATTGEEMLWQQILREGNDYRRVEGGGGGGGGVWRILSSTLLHTPLVLGKKELNAEYILDTVNEFEETRVGNDVIKGQHSSLTEIGVYYHHARYFGLQSVYF